MAEPVSEDVARNRWLVINAVRFSGVAMILIGILVSYRVIPAPGWAGYLLMAVGFFEVFLAPTLLARRWRSPPS